MTFPLRSFVLRQGRMTIAQKQALQNEWAAFGLTTSADCDWQILFGREAPRILEIGFGMGDALISMARAHPEMDFIGIEVHLPGVGACLRAIREFNLTNIRLFSEDAQAVLQKFPPQSIDKVFLLFSDPWPKRKHHKRRLVQPLFVKKVASILKSQGIFHLATDWQPYAEHMFEILEGSDFVNCEATPYRPETKFERRGREKGHLIWDFAYKII